MNKIVLICDDAYVLATMVTIQSIIANATVDYNVCVCSFGLSDENIDRFKSQSTERVSVTVIILDMDNFSENFSKVTQKTHVTKAALIKLELPNIFPDEKLLYIDSDIIIKSDISQLFSIELGDSYLAASYEFWKYIEQIHYVFKPFRYTGSYLNSGVMLLNLKKMREDNITEKLWSYKLGGCKTTAMDQECFNAVCGDNAIKLSNLWNFNPEFFEEEYLPAFMEIYGIEYRNLDDFFADVRIIHYVGKHDKPWNYKNARMGEIWNDYYNMLSDKPVITYKHTVTNEESYIKRINRKIRTHGIIGTVHFVLYKLGIKL